MSLLQIAYDVDAETTARMPYSHTKADSALSLRVLTNGGMCVSDGTGYHTNNERCTVTANGVLYATATFFDTESFFDYIQIGSTRCKRAAPPAARLAHLPRARTSAL